MCRFILPFLLNAVNVDLKVARFLLSLIPAEDILELVLGHELAEISDEQGGARSVANGDVRLRGGRSNGRRQCRGW